MEEEAVEIKLNGGVWVREQMIGRGGSATVFLGKAKETQKSDQSFQPLIAVKSASLNGADDLFDEYGVFSELIKEGSSPHILQFLGEYFTHENRDAVFNLCFEYAPGGSLSDRILKSKQQQQMSDCGGLPEIEVRRYTHSILQGLKYIHEHGFVHCDLKPDNILICENNVAKIADFGLSVKTPHPKSKFTFRGTPLYVAPEEIFSQSYEPISDVWGLGCIVLEMLSGREPWGFDERKIDFNSILCFIANSKELPMVPRKLSPLAIDFLRKCLVRDTKLRWNPDMLLKHPFIDDIDRKKTITDEIVLVTEEASCDDEYDFGLPWPDLPSFALIKDKMAAIFGITLPVVVDADALVVAGEKRKRMTTKDEEVEELKKWQKDGFGLKKCSVMMTEANNNSIGAMPCGF